MTVKKNQIEATQIFTGSGTPSNGTGTDGDFYIRTTNGDYYSKSAGSWGSPIASLMGPQGAAGAAGSQILTGSSIPSGGLGNNGDLYIRTNSSADYYTKSGGSWTIQGSLQGPQGTAGTNGSDGVFSAIASQAEAEAGVDNVKGMTPLRVKQAIDFNGGGGGGPTALFSNTQRYRTDSTSNQETYVLSSSKVVHSLSWTRSGTTLTISHTSHGRSVGDRVLIHNANSTFLNATIDTVPNSDSFTVTCVNTGGTSGSAAAYGLGVTTSQASNKLTVTLPSGGDVKIISMRFRGTSSGAGNFDVQITGTGLDHGVGGSTDRTDVNVPIVRVSGDTDTLTAVGATIAVNNSSAGYDEYRLAALGNSLVRMFSLNF